MLSTQVNQASDCVRLDKFLCEKFSISFDLAQKLIRQKKVKVNDKKVDPSYKIQLSDQIKIFADLAARPSNKKSKPKISKQKIAEFLSYKIFEDENLFAINKPSGLATQGGSGVKISVADFLLSLDPSGDLQLVHRLDKDTSGILLVAKNAKSSEFLTAAFRNKIVKKTYLALVCGVLSKSSGIINIPLRKKMIGKNEKVRPDFIEGKEAITEFKVLKTFADHSLLALKPLTGRTHQLRVHCKELGHPIINDVKYGGREVLRKDLSSRLCLHAFEIEISEYFGKVLKITTRQPDFLK